MLRYLAPLALLFASPALAEPAPPNQQTLVEAELAKAPKGTRFGLLVVDDSGKVVVAINPDQRFIPASNTKLFTTAAAYALLPGVDQPDAEGATQVSLVPGKKKGVFNVVLTGRGDTRMSSAANCQQDCLATLADAVAARTKVAGDVIGDDTRFPDQRWSPGMSWNNFGSNDATATSALSLDSNELMVKALPGTLGKPPLLVVPPYVTVRNEAVTVAPGGKANLVLEHTVNSRDFRLYGELPADAGEWRERIGIDDPAHFTAWTFAAMLKARGVKIAGKIQTSHRPVGLVDDPDWRARNAVAIDTARGGPVLAGLVPPPLAEDIVIINKVSQNNHAETMLRRIGRVEGTGSLEDGLAATRALYERAGIPREGYDFSDGSGMSTYNRVSPRAGVALLRWVDGQPWGKAWHASLPIAGVDGTLKRRFLGTPLAGNLAAKTGTLNATNALSGTFRAASGKRLTFSFFANDVPNGESAIPAMEAALLAIYAAN
ncbi:D-alanyl-D-alanine carboxypeptidase/D-alanyl-D-alanine-endopeptidase [Novosphingobium sp.]|uniref:D-alanyl-D-alanine carboxypeptidase/D-alanyl-D-alanine endopeptidase n=1 Tax=Novosphingobium sp. TaxID=1874826 RepID=UPI0025DF70EE|nr:D-alanyl-D-alanine carboxypeptidase/D-alanyl-D-alanine-endopeptidase [Novosphingobium sp.]MCC6925366.1 D-alanyl-D-alanine carboxypeptidase/D-alanyl-D-alanine-endopeptidase [Novosphingobium sp.]